MLKVVAEGYSDFPAFGPHRAERTRGANTMREAHRKAAEQHERAAHAHRTAAEHNEKGNNEAGNWHSQRALEYSDNAYKLAKEAHSKSGEIVAI